MQLFFIDESGTIPPKNKSNGVDFFTLGGKELAILKTTYKVF
jgi:hypothetical protein